MVVVAKVAAVAVVRVVRVVAVVLLVAVTRPKSQADDSNYHNRNKWTFPSLVYRLVTSGNLILDCHRDIFTSQLHRSNRPPCSGHFGGVLFLP